MIKESLFWVSLIRKVIACKGVCVMPTWSDIEKYCRDRLKEIADINKNHNCPSGFVCIVAFLAYLSRLAFGTNVKRDRHDGDWFKKFITNFMPQKYHGHEDLMYRTFRCGILHSMSFDDEIDGNRTVYLANNGGGTTGDSALAITHSMVFAPLCNGSVLQRDSSTNAFVLVADVLCDDIESAINVMFKNVAVQKNCEEFVACQRYITGKSVPCNSLSQVEPHVAGGVLSVSSQQIEKPDIEENADVSTEFNQQLQGKAFGVLSSSTNLE